MNNESNKDTTPEYLEYLEKNAYQRAALMAFIVKLMTEQSDTYTLHNVKICIANFFSRLIDDQNLVYDLIEKHAFDEVLTFARQEDILEIFKVS